MTPPVEISPDFGHDHELHAVTPTDDDLAEHDAAFEEANDTAHKFARAVDERVHRLRIEEAARAKLAAERTADVPPFDAGTLGQILARPPEPAHRCEGIIPANAGTLLVAQRKTGKTTLELNLARCLLTGDDFLGRFPTTRVHGTIAILNYEVSAAQLARWARDHDIDPDRLFIVNLRGRRNPLAHDPDRQALAATLRSRDVETLVVDPFGRAYTGQSQNDPGEVGAWLSDLDQFSRSDVGASDIILTAHAGWNGERTRGSTALEDWADTIITVSRDKEDDHIRFLRAEGRDVLVDEDQLTYDPHTRTLTLNGTGSRRTAATVRRLEALKPLVLEALATAPSMSGNQIDQWLKNSDTDLSHSKGDGKRVAQLLEKTGLVASRDGKRNSRQFTLLTSPTSLDLPEGNSVTSPTSLYREGSHEGTQTPTPTPGNSTPTPHHDHHPPEHP